MKKKPHKKQASPQEQAFAIAQTFHANALKLIDQGKNEEAQSQLRLALAKIPQLDGSTQSLGNSLESEDPEAAVAAYRQSCLINPSFALAYASLGGILQNELHRDKEALEYLALAYALNPKLHPVYVHLGLRLMGTNQLEQAYAFLKKAQSIASDPSSIIYNQSLIELMLGDLENGFKDYESRWNCILKHNKPSSTKPEWQGQSLKDKTLLITMEQGAGDSIQFARYATLASREARQVFIQVDRPLARLFESLEGATPVQEIPEDYDFYCSALTLPLRCKTTAASIPDQSPYLKASTADSGYWKKWFQSKAPQNRALRVGLTWAGNPMHKNDHNRSIPFDALAPLMKLSGIQWVNLQKERLPDDFSEFSDQHGWLNPIFQVSDFADTAAVIDNLDLVIAVDTSTAHLAGALGKPVWLLLPHVPDWRWMLNYPESTPWYPSMRIFRQPDLTGGWQPVIEKVCEALQLLQAGKLPPPLAPSPQTPLVEQILDFSFLPAVEKPVLTEEQDHWRKRIVASPFWYHRIKLPCGLETPGWSPIEPKLYDLPESMAGMRVLDIGTRDGYWAFEALKRGAREVVAIDDFSDNYGLPHEAYRRDWTNFDLCREALGFSESVCQRKTLSAYDLKAEELGRFDYVFLFGVFHQLRHPLLALEKIAAVCDDTLIIESPILDNYSATNGGLNHGYPNQIVMEFCPHTQFENNPANWWIPTLQTLALMANTAGFPEVDGWKMNDLPIRRNQCRGFVKAGRKRNRAE